MHPWLAVREKVLKMLSRFSPNRHRSPVDARAALPLEAGR
jgi:hypothetical protein